MTHKPLVFNQTLNQFYRTFQARSSADLPMHQQQVLFGLALEPDPITPTQLALATGVTKAAVTKTITPLIDGGYLEKAADPDDFRSFTISLSKKGRAELATLEHDYFQNLRDLQHALGPKKMKKLLKLMKRALKKAPVPDK